MPIGFALNSAPLWKCLVGSISIVIAGTCQHEAPKYVSSLVRMLGKSFTMMLVIVNGLTVSGMRYCTTEWLIAAAVTGCLTEFLLAGPTSSGDDSDSMYGLMLLAVLLALYGSASTFQEQMFKEPGTSKYDAMLYISLDSC